VWIPTLIHCSPKKQGIKEGRASASNVKEGERGELTLLPLSEREQR